MIAKGQKINDRYEIIRLIGEGGMANVYLAMDTILERKVAVKVLRGDLADDEKFVRRFQREAKAASDLIHPNIVEMYDVGEDNGEYYIVMEYVDGKTLKNLVKKRGGLTLTETLDIMQQLTSAISCAHDSYIIHRDIKPQNVLIMDDGKVKITDFGIAQALNSGEITQTNSVMGSVHYLPPEQANGSGATKKSDIYSLGILMYELLIGKLPFKGDNAVEIALKQMRDPIPSICEQREDIPQSIENIILKATAKNPQNRYDSVDEMQEDLRTSLDRSRRDEEKIEFEYPEHETIGAPSSERRSRITKNQDESEDPEEKKSKKALIITGAILTGLVVIGTIIFLVSNMIKTPNVDVPSVKNMTVKKAKSTLKSKGFKINTKIHKVYNEKMKKGKVIKTDPKAGRTVKKGAVITLYVSKGKEGYKIEDYTGQNIKTITEKLEEEGIIVNTEKVDYTEDDNVEENIIISQDIEAGKKLSKGDTITFTIPNIVATYPDFVSEMASVTEVEKFCKTNGLTLVKKEKESSETTGTIIYQSQTAGKKVVKGATLTIIISKKVTTPTTTPTTTTTSSTQSEATT